MKSRRRFTFEQEEALCRLYEDGGRSLRDLVREFGTPDRPLHVGTVQKILLRNGVPMREPGNPRTSRQRYGPALLSLQSFRPHPPEGGPRHRSDSTPRRGPLPNPRPSG